MFRDIEIWITHTHTHTHTYIHTHRKPLKMSVPANATLALTPFKVAIPQKDIEDFKTLLHLSKLPPATFEGSTNQYGVTNKWMKEMKAYWESTFDWYVLRP